MTALAAQVVDDGLEAAQLVAAVHHAISGTVVPYNTLTDVGLLTEELARGAFTASLAQRSAPVPLLLWHDNRSFPVGIADSWDDRWDGLYATFRTAMNGVAHYAASQAREGHLTGMSVGFSPIRSSWRVRARLESRSRT